MTGRGPRYPESGSALYLVILVAVLLAASGAILRGNFLSLARERTRGRHSLAARWAAEGGIAKARAALAAEPGWSGGAVDVGGGRAEVTVRAVPGDAALREIVSIADFPAGAADTLRARRRVVATVRLREGLPAVTGWSESPP